MKDKFFSIIAHDLKNPLNTLIGYTELLDLKYDKWNEEKSRKVIHTINEAALQLYKLLENLLQWARSQRGLLEIKKQKLNVIDLIRITLKDLQSTASKKGISVRTEIDNEKLSVLADKEMLLTIFRNLLSNAIKFTPEEGNIWIKAFNSGSFTHFIIEDTGVGIPDEALEKLFRIDGKYSTEGTNAESGTGLGLILCKEFVDKHQGKIWVESEIEKGSRFHIEIPAK